MVRDPRVSQSFGFTQNPIFLKSKSYTPDFEP